MPINTLPPYTGVLLLAAGTGTRFGGNKLRKPLGGQSVLDWSLQTFLSLKPAALVLVGSVDLAPADIISVPGGATRRASVLAGMAVLPPEIKRVLIHDAARPGVTPEMIFEVTNALKRCPAALPLITVTDTIRQGTSTTLDRASLSAAQTPQGFDRHILENCLNSLDASDEIQSVEAQGFPVAYTQGARRNHKLTYPEDLAMLTALLCPSITVTGLGFDVHRFCTPEEAAGRTLVLGGLKMPGEQPLAGHSDADVLLHALCDAIYGALGEGDIGAHFPPSDAIWKDRDSTHFLSHALARIAARGGTLVHADLTLICEMPKLRPVEAAMRARLKDLTGLERFGLKATTTEQMGFTGRGEGIAAQALVTLRLPE